MAFWRKPSKRKGARKRAPGATGAGGWIVRLLRAALVGATALAFASVGAVAVYGVVPPPATPLMLIRGLEEDAWPRQRQWVPLARISRHLQRAVLANEDNRFCTHGGFDWVELGKVYRAWRAGDETRGASTITNQLAKNLFLWPGRSMIRKGAEAWFTVLLEALWSKDRILETYLNVVEFGDGIYGAEAASRHYFKRPAAELTQLQAALLTAALPNPRVRGDEINSAGMRSRAGIVLQRFHFIALGDKGVCP